MNKTLNINIGNSIIHIEEDAYETLRGYLNEVKSHFANHADDFEIVTDIENRIAELFNEILTTQHKAAIDYQDVNAVIGKMGRVQDFGAEEEVEGQDYPNYAQPRAQKKIYRDPDAAYIAGVCAGLSHYLRTDVSVIRILAVVTTFFGGAGFFAYLILWIVFPQANTRSEKMNMMGEKADLQGFKRNLEKEMEDLRNRPFVKRSGGFIAEFFNYLGVFFKGAGRTLVKAIAIFIVVFGVILLLSLIGTLSAFFGFFDVASYQFFPLTIVNGSMLAEVSLAFFVTLSIPLVALILFSLRVAFNKQAINRTISYTLLLLWLAGVSASVFYVAKITAEFTDRAEFTQVKEIKPHKTYSLIVDRSRFFTKEDSLRYNITASDYKGRVILNDLDGPFEEPRDITLDVEKSTNGKTTLSENYSASGRTFENALQHAQNIHYDFVQQDSILNFSPRLQLLKSTNWRAQEVKLVLKVPVGTRLLVSYQVKNYLRAYRFWNCDDHQTDDELIEWVMTEDGLKCAAELFPLAEEVVIDTVK